MLDEDFYESMRTHMQRTSNCLEDLSKLTPELAAIGGAHPEYQPHVLRFFSITQNLIEGVVELNLDIVKLARNQMAQARQMLGFDLPTSNPPSVPPETPDDKPPSPQNNLPAP